MGEMSEKSPNAEKPKLRAPIEAIDKMRKESESESELKFAKKKDKKKLFVLYFLNIIVYKVQGLILIKILKIATTKRVSLN